MAGLAGSRSAPAAPVKVSSMSPTAIASAAHIKMSSMMSPPSGARTMSNEELEEAFADDSSTEATTPDGNNKGKKPTAEPPLEDPPQPVPGASAPNPVPRTSTPQERFEQLLAPPDVAGSNMTSHSMARFVNSEAANAVVPANPNSSLIAAGEAAVVPATAINTINNGCVINPGEMAIVPGSNNSLVPPKSAKQLRKTESVRSRHLLTACALRRRKQTK